MSSSDSGSGGIPRSARLPLMIGAICSPSCRSTRRASAGDWGRRAGRHADRRRGMRCRSRNRPTTRSISAGSPGGRCCAGSARLLPTTPALSAAGRRRRRRCLGWRVGGAGCCCGVCAACARTTVETAHTTAANRQYLGVWALGDLLNPELYRSASHASGGMSAICSCRLPWLVA